MTAYTMHDYPAEEIEALMDFYGGKTCVITHNELADWAHMLNADGTERLAWMLSHNLRQDKHLRHAVETRENVIPLAPTQHRQIDKTSPAATLFLHEDILARTLACELELQQWRRTEMQAGRTDPGRPDYADVFEVSGIMQHRWHCIDTSFAWRGVNIYYDDKDCPGVYPFSSNPFPIINTLLIPFSLLHTLPRLISLMPSTEYTNALITIGRRIVELWSWVPSPEELRASEAVRVTGNVNGTRTPRPLPINHSCRQATTFVTMRPHTVFGAITTSRNMAPKDLTSYHSTSELDSAEVLLSKTPSISWHPRDGLQLTASISASEGSDGSSDGQGVAPDLDTGLRSSDIMAWLHTIVGNVEEEEVPSLTLTPFRKGVISSMSLNDILMIKGLIDPGVYVQYLTLESFSLYLTSTTVS